MKICSTRNPLDALRSLAVIGAALAASSGAAQQAPPEEIVVTSSIIPQPRRQVGTAMSVIGFGCPCGCAACGLAKLISGTSRFTMFPTFDLK